MNTSRAVEVFLNDYFDAHERSGLLWEGVTLRVEGSSVVLIKGIGKGVKVATVEFDDGTVPRPRMAETLERLVSDIRAGLAAFLPPRARWLAEKEPFMPRGFRRFGR